VAEIPLTLSDADVDRIVDRLAERLGAAGLPAGNGGQPERLYWREGEAAKALGVSLGWLKQQRLRGNIAATSNSKPVLYSRGDLDAVAEFIAKHSARAD
jgi:hypothetical protein